MMWIFHCFIKSGRNPRRSESEIIAEQIAKTTGPFDYPVFPPPPPQDIQAYRADYVLRLRARKFRSPQGAKYDTPTHSLYRLYEMLVVDHVTGYRDELEYFWNQGDWPVKDIPDPKDEEPARYAFLACVTKLMVRVYNTKIKLGQARGAPAILTLEECEYLRTQPESTKAYEEVPPWTENIPPLATTLLMRSHDGIEMEGLEDERASDIFKDKNILLRRPNADFI